MPIDLAKSNTTCWLTPGRTFSIFGVTSPRSLKVRDHVRGGTFADVAVLIQENRAGTRGLLRGFAIGKIVVHPATAFEFRSASSWPALAGC